MTFDAIQMIIIATCTAGIGFLVCLVKVALDPKVVRLDSDFVIVKREAFERLCTIAQVKQKTPELTFDKSGHLKHEIGTEEDDA